MSGFESAGAWAFDRLVEVSWQVAVLALCVLAATALVGRRLTPRWHLALWLVVAARLCVPVLPELDHAPVRWALPAAALPRPERPATPTTADPLAGIPAPDRARPARERARPPGAAAGPSAERSAGSARPAPTRPPLTLTAPPADSGAAAASVEPPLGPADPPAWKPLAAAAWLAVALALLARAVRRELVFLRGLRNARGVEDPTVLALLDGCRRAAGVRRGILLLESELVDSPAATGVFRPRILLPVGATDTFRPDELRHFLLHEAWHLRRHDVVANWLLVLLGSAFWFHPLARLALRRIRAVREEVRDWDALASDRSSSPHTYARTLLALVERRAAVGHRPVPAIGFFDGGSDLKRRILVVTDFARPRRLSLALGPVLLGALVCSAFATATPPDPGSAEPPRQNGPTLDYREVGVQRHSEDPPWMEEMRAKLARRVSADFTDATMRDAVDALGGLLDVPIVVEPSYLESFGDQPSGVSFEHTTGARVLDLFGEVHGCGWHMTRGAVWLGDPQMIPRRLELRVYTIEPILERLADYPDFLDEHAELLVDQLVTFTGVGDGSWESEGASVQFWNGLLLVRQSPAVHAEVEELLGRLLNDGRARPRSEEPWRRALEEQLAQPFELDFDRADIAAIEATFANAGVPVRIENDGDELEVDLNLRGQSLRASLEWIAFLGELRVDLREDGVYLTRTPRYVVETYDVRDLIRDTDFADEEYEALDELIRRSIDPASWDELWWSTGSVWNGILIVAQTHENQRAIGAFLETLRRALGN